MNDPMDALRLPVVPIAPRPGFAADLRAQVQRWLGGDDDPAAATEVRPIIPYLSVRGARDAIGWYVEVFGATVEGDPILEPDGRIGHAELAIGGAHLYLADEFPEIDTVSPLTRGGPSLQLQLVVDDCDATFARAVGAGATARREPADQFYGARAAAVRDPWGHDWQLHQPLEAITRERLAENAAELGLAVATVDLGSRGGEPPAPAPQGQRPAGRVGDVGYWTLDVPDPDVSAGFFRELFGWTIEQGDLPAGRHIADVTPPGGIHGGRAPGATLYFRVEDLGAAVARVRALGGEVREVADYETGGGARCLDPQGVPFDLWKPAPGY